MTPNKKIFCNSPWFELQIYWDGSYGFCCAEDHKIYPEAEKEKYNVRTMSIKEWMNSAPMQRIRKEMFGNKELSICKMCRDDELMSGTSRRHKCNSKSAIFTKTNFNESYKQSPHRHIFDDTLEQDGSVLTYPIDMHIDLGNYCNLACKMCTPLASSKIASQYKKWDIGIDNKKRPVTGKILNDWTQDDAVWESVCDEIISFKNLNNIHFMGGETMLTKRFSDFLDRLVDSGKVHTNISFVTNGTVIDNTVIGKLEKIKGRVNIECSIETTTEHNSYIRQGTDTQKVIDNISTYIDICERNNWDFTIRPAISNLSIGKFHTLLQFCLEKKLVMKSLAVTHPSYMDVRHLPQDVKNLYKQKYLEFLEVNDMQGVNLTNDYNESDKNEYKKIIAKDANFALAMLGQPQTPQSRNMLKELKHWCMKWDLLYGFDMQNLYPELQDHISG